MSEVMQAKELNNEVALDREAQAARAGAYRLLASLLCAIPTAEFIQQLAHLPQDTEQKDSMSEAFSALSQASGLVTSEQISNEYQALFIGIGRGEVVPYGCFYMTGFLMEKPLGALRDDLGLLGYSRQEGIKEPEDHIAFLCEVMSLMISDDLLFEKQKKFFEAHIAPWASRFFSDLIAAESADFYSRAGDMGLAFMAFEQSYFSMPA